MPGPFFFAWVDPGETTFNASHEREDAIVFSFTVGHNESEVASLSLEVRNPLVGLLSAGRKTWAWLSWQRGPGDVVPLFFGRLVGIPDDITKELVTLVFSARPADYDDAKAALADTLKVPPFYDPVWVDEAARVQADTVLEARSALWHVDRVTHAVTVSDILVGEDGVQDFTGDDAFYDSVAIHLSEAPLTAVRVQATINWTQSATGTVDFKPPYFLTYSGDGLISNWPKEGVSVQGGWTVLESSATDDYNVAAMSLAEKSFRFENRSAEHVNGDVLTSEVSQSFPVLNGPAIKVYLSTTSSQNIDSETGNANSSSAERTSVMVPLWRVTTGLVMQYDAARERVETVDLTMTADLQPIVTLAENAVETIQLSSADVGVAIDAVLPVGDLKRRAYLSTDRGLQSLEYLVALARARLLVRSRAVQVEWECPFELAIGLSCRKNARLFDRRLPGGVALGKIVSYGFSANGDTGALVGKVTIACAVGYGGAAVPNPGAPIYVDDGYVNNGWQVRENQVIVLSSGDIGYSVPIDAITDDGVVFPLTKQGAVLVETVHGDYVTQGEVITAALNTYRFVVPSFLLNDYFQQIEAYKRKASSMNTAISGVIKANPIWYELRVRSVTNGPFESAYAVTVSSLSIPKQIDLEAAT